MSVPGNVGVYILVHVGVWVCIYSVCYVVGVAISCVNELKVSCR